MVLSVMLVRLAFIGDGWAAQLDGVERIVPYKNEEIKKFMEEINSLISKSSLDRDYSRILQIIESLAQSYPDSEDTFLMLDTAERWKSLDLISDEQYAPLKKALSDFRAVRAKEETFLKSVGMQYHRFMESETGDARLLKGINQSCQDALASPNSTMRVKSHALMLLAEVSMRQDNVHESESFLKKLFNEIEIEQQDFVDAESIRLEANRLMSKVLLKTEGVNESLRFFRERLEAHRQSFDDIANAYEQMFLLLESSREEGVSEQKIALLREFIAQYSENASEQVLQARLTLGYLVLNDNTDLSGIVTMEQAKEHALRYKSNAEEAETIFTEGLLLATNNTRFEQAFRSAIEVVAKAKNPKYPTEPSNDYSSDLDFVSHRNYAALIIIDVSFLVLILFLYRKEIVRTIKSFFRPNNLS
jgi:hypothetical protein